MESIKDILKRMCQFYEVSNNRQLSEKISINYNTISTWIKRDSIPYDLLHKLVHNENISFDWLLTGKGEMLQDVATNAQVQLSQQEAEIVQDYRVLEKEDQEIFYHELKTAALKAKKKAKHI